jgi:hypothetical protein
MLWAVVAFVGVWAVGILGLNAHNPANYGIMAMHVLMAAYFAHLLARTIYLSVRYLTLMRSYDF